MALGDETRARKYTVGKGSVYFELQNTDGFIYLGNAPAVAFNMELEELLHFSSRSGINTQDGSVITQQDVTGTMTLDDIQNQNLRLFFMGSAATVSVQAVLTDQAQIIVNAQQDRVYRLGVFNISAVSVDDNLDSQTYVLDTDYELDAVRGLIYITEASAIDSIDIKVEFNQAQTTLTTINAATSTSIKGKLLFSGDPAEGTLVEIIGFCLLKPGGEANMITDEWMELPFEFKFEAHSDFTGLFDLTQFGTVSQA